MFSLAQLKCLDYRSIFVIIALMFLGLLVISSASALNPGDASEDSFFTPYVLSQIRGYVLGIGVYLFCASLDYNKLREWTWILYLLMIIALVGLFFTPSIQNVHRWYRIPFINFSFQPSESAKLIVVISLSWFLERRKSKSQSWSTTLAAGIIVGIPFLLILKQPDLGTALVLFPVTLVMFYFGNANPLAVRLMTIAGIVILSIVLIFFMGIVSHEKMRPYMTTVMKDYQYERLNPDTHHQKAALTAIALGQLTGKGWKKSEYTASGWLPAAHTDSVFPAFGEEFGLLGLLLVMVLYYTLIYFSFQVTAVAKDHFGRLLSAGLAVYLAMHILVNIGMMCGFLPITGVPLVLMTYGPSSVLTTMAALGILQSIYSRRFMFS